VKIGLEDANVVTIVFTKDFLRVTAAGILDADSERFDEALDNVIDVLPYLRGELLGDIPSFQFTHKSGEVTPILKTDGGKLEIIMDFLQSSPKEAAEILLN